MNSSKSAWLVLFIILLLTLLAACSTSASPAGDETPSPAATTAEELPIATATEPPATATEEPPMATATAEPTAAPTAAATIAVTATSAPTATVTATAESGPATLSPSICCLGRDVESGRYATPQWFDIPFAFEVDTGWRAVNESAATLFFLAKGENSIGHADRYLAFFVLPAGTTVADFIADLRATPLLDTSAPEPVTYAGVSGQALDATAQPNPDATGNEGRVAGSILLSAVHQAVAPGTTWYTESAEARLRFILLDAGDRTLFIYIEAPPEEFETFAAEAEQVLQTLEFEEEE